MGLNPIQLDRRIYIYIYIYNIKAELQDSVICDLQKKQSSEQASGSLQTRPTLEHC